MKKTIISSLIVLLILFGASYTISRYKANLLMSYLIKNDHWTLSKSHIIFEIPFKGRTLGWLYYYKNNEVFTDSILIYCNIYSKIVLTSPRDLVKKIEEFKTRIN